MIKQFLQIAGVKNEKEFLAKYPTEASFFKAHPEARQLANQSSGFTPNYESMMPQAMYGMSMGYGGYTPRAANGMQVQDPPRQEDYPDYESFSQAMDQYIASLQQQADTSQAVPQSAANAAPVSAPSPYPATNKFNLKGYQGVSVADFLTAQGKPSDFSSRKELASSLGIANYRGTAGQNTQMMQMLQQNPDILSDYNGIGQPTGGFKKAASASRNVKGAPSTESLAEAKQAALLANRPTQANTSLQGNSVNPFAMADMSNNLVRRDFNTGRMVANTTGPMMLAENAKRMQLADQLNRAAAARASGQPMFSQGYAKGGEWTGTWNANQGFAVGGAYLPDYADSAYGLPQFELGAPIYADGGMSPEEAMMMQQQQGAGAPPQAGGEGQGQFDQQQVIQAVFQMLQQGMPPEQIIQQLVQGGVPQEVAQQIIQMVMQQVQGGGAEGGQEGMGGGQPNGVQQPQAPAGPEQGMQGMPMPGGMARGGIAPGWEGEVTMQQLEELRKKGVKFDII